MITGSSRSPLSRHALVRRAALALAGCAALAGCTGPSADSGYVTLLREAMVESARQGHASDHPEPAMRAVAAWREAEAEQRDTGGVMETAAGALQ